ncbi:glycoside hydrolase family 2 protein [Persicobacter diffluens]|uniref:Beta-glucuronidase n=1 Tax=Persicobacter diffluens TaxID=981 RepID=A0AAN5APZ4_9BACT|nr:beta-glucuronidase [Persicobacter diffluens]
MKKFIIFICFLATALSVQGTDLLHNAFNREAVSLNGKWHYIVDPYENGYYDYRRSPYDTWGRTLNPGTSAYYQNSKAKDKTERCEYNFDNAATMTIPSSWTTQVEALHWYEGVVWYQRNFQHYKKDGKRAYLYFGAVNYEAHVYVNGKKVGLHIGGFTPFNFDITDFLKEDGQNFVVVKVDNTRKEEAVPTVNTDWWNHGGITREVKIIDVPEVYIADYRFTLDKKDRSHITANINVGGVSLATEVVVDIPELKVRKVLQTDENGNAQISFKNKKLQLWSPEQPKLYEVKLSVANDQLTDRIGFRTIETKGAQILLNGAPYPLRGICAHEENPIGGRRNYSETDARQMFQWAKDLNANFMRLAHYPHNEYMPRLADELGFLLWEEIPVYWTIAWENEATLANAKQQLSDVIFRDKNRAAVIIWSVANETPVSEARNMFLTNLVQTVRSKDDSRLVSAAMEVSRHQETGAKVIDDPFGEVVDIMSFNQYHGWYGGDIAAFKNIKWEVKYNKPVIVSEWGAGALAGYHADKQTVWSEEYQAEIYEKTLDGINNIPNLAGFTPWALCDFRSPRRPLADIQDMWNRKGIIGEGGTKKQAFYILSEFYQQQKHQYLP